MGSIKGLWILGRVESLMPDGSDIEASPRFAALPMADAGGGQLPMFVPPPGRIDRGSRRVPVPTASPKN